MGAGLSGAYLKRPIETKISEDHQNKKFAYGVSSMQGWRSKQEDAHNCLLDFDEETSLFGVYDGHGGAEVAIYTSEKLPEFIKETAEYKSGNYKEALSCAFLNFDDTIPSETALARLKEIIEAEKNDDVEEQEESSTIVFTERAQCSHSDENGDEDDADYEYGDIGDPETETPDSLRRDASRPLEEVIASYRVPGVAGSSSGCNSSFSGECSTSFVQSSSSAGESSASSYKKVETSENDDAEASPAVNGESKECSSGVISNESEEVSKSAKSSKDESLSNGPSVELANGVANPMNGDVAEEVESSSIPEVKKCEKLDQPSPSKSERSETPSCSTPSKKKKLALTDLDDSDVVKNFITNDEISEDDEDDSEDETFQLDEGLENDSEDDDDDDEEDLGESLLSKLKRRLCQAAMEAARDEDDSEDDGPTSSEPNEDAEDEEDEDDETFEAEDEEESEDSSDDDDEDDKSAISLFTEDSCKPGVDSGCTAVVALIKGNTLYVANAGDSRCIISKDGVAIDMSEDHKPQDKLEKERIEKAGGEVTWEGRVNGRLNLSRAIGDHEYKKNDKLPNTEQMIIALPDVRVYELDSEIEFIVLACDGIWNSMSSQEVVNFVRPKIQSNQKLSTICEELFDKCLAPDTWNDGSGCDNMTCIIVKPKHGENENTCDTEIDTKITTTSANPETISVSATEPSTDDVVGSSHSEQDDKDNEAVPSAEQSESSAVEVEEGKGDAALSSTSQKRCADSTDDEVGTQAKRKKTEQTDDSS